MSYVLKSFEVVHIMRYILISYFPTRPSMHNPIS